MWDAPRRQQDSFRVHTTSHLQAAFELILQLLAYCVCIMGLSLGMFSDTLQDVCILRNNCSSADPYGLGSLPGIQRSSSGYTPWSNLVEDLSHYRVYIVLSRLRVSTRRLFCWLRILLTSWTNLFKIAWKLFQQISNKIYSLYPMSSWT